MVEYEIAQQPIHAVRSTGDAHIPVPEEIQVVCADSAGYPEGDSMFPMS